MFDFQQKRKIKKVIYSRITILVLFVVVLLLGNSTYKIYKKERLSSEDYNQTKREYESLKERQAMLDSEIARLKTDNGIEEEIRSKFSVAKPGETVIVIVDSSSTSQVDGRFTASVWSRFMGWFK